MTIHDQMRFQLVREKKKRAINRRVFSVKQSFNHDKLFFASIYNYIFFYNLNKKNIQNKKNLNSFIWISPQGTISEVSMEAYLSPKNFAFVFKYNFFEENKFHTQ